MEANKNALWVEKYRPKTLKDYIFQDSLQEKTIKKMIEDKSIPHLLFSGIQGSGKTSIALILINELNVDPSDVLIINASDENKAEIIRDKIKSFISTYPFGDFKVVLLEEGDYITPLGQGIMRRMMEEYSNSARFLLTCNYENKVIPALRSRFQHFRFKASDKDDITELAAKILLNEDVKFDLDVLDKFVSTYYPDIRKTINSLQQYSIDGQLHLPHSSSEESGDYRFLILELLNQDKWAEIRDVICANVAGEEWDELYTFLYQNLNKSKKFKDTTKWGMGIITIADYMHHHALSSDPALNASAMFIKLGQI